MAALPLVVDGDERGKLLLADHLLQLAAGSFRHEEALDAVVHADLGLACSASPWRRNPRGP